MVLGRSTLHADNKLNSALFAEMIQLGKKDRIFHVMESQGMRINSTRLNELLGIYQVLFSTAFGGLQ